MSIRVLQLIYKPELPAVMGWNNPYELATSFIHDVYTASHNRVKYEIIKSVEIDEFPVQEFSTIDEYRYFCEKVRRDTRVEYIRVVRDALDCLPSFKWDEIWAWGGPWFGFYESQMIGRNAIFCNSYPIRFDFDPFVVMGFNYERGVAEMLESLGHRIESTLDRSPIKREWQKFTRYERAHPGQASECGNVHWAPNSEHDYDWGNKRIVFSNYQQWYHYPEMRHDPIPVNCHNWGNGDARLHKLWWMGLIPPDWWRYIYNLDWLEQRKLSFIQLLARFFGRYKLHEI